MNQDELGSWNRAVASADGARCMDDTWSSQQELYVQYSQLLHWSSSLSWSSQQELYVQYSQLLHWSSSLSKASLPEGRDDLIKLMKNSTREHPRERKDMLHVSLSKKQRRKASTLPFIGKMLIPPLQMQ